MSAPSQPRTFPLLSSTDPRTPSVRPFPGRFARPQVIDSSYANRPKALPSWRGASLRARFAKVDEFLFVAQAFTMTRSRPSRARGLKRCIGGHPVFPVELASHAGGRVEIGNWRTASAACWGRAPRRRVLQVADAAVFELVAPPQTRGLKLSRTVHWPVSSPPASLGRLG